MSQPAAAAQRPAGPFAVAAANALSIGLLIGLSIATFAYERTLQPLYGSAATKHHLNKVVWGAAIAGTFLPTVSGWTSLFVSGVLLCAMPQTSYWAAVYTARMGDAIWGPVLTHLGVITPVLYLGFSVVKELQKNNDTSNMMGAPMNAITLPVCRMAVMTLQELWPLFPVLRNANDRDIMVYIGMSALLVWTVLPFLPSFEDAAVTATKAGVTKPKPQSSGGGNLLRIALLPLLPFILSHLHAPTLPKPLAETFVHPNASLRILSSAVSPYSGVVVVGEIPSPSAAQIASGDIQEPHSVRYLRAGPSLLGGVWIGDRVYRRDGKGPLGVDASNNPIGDSIYGAFIMQEAARLAIVPTEEKPKALFIGLGTGIAASAFIKHDISSTVVEIDPAVYDAATQYFGFVADPQQVAIQDARVWVLKKSQEFVTAEDKTKNELFDYVIHDCFSGGSVPGHVFTQLFWEDLSKIVKPEGVIAVNFAGKLYSDSLKAILLTLKSVFPQCRAFHDSMEQRPLEEISDEFINFVFFCTPSSKPLTFRPAVEADFLQSFLREKVLSTISEREVDLAALTKDLDENDTKRYILTDMKNPLVEWQDLEALHHWKVMRDVLPDVCWETY